MRLQSPQLHAPTLSWAAEPRRVAMPRAEYMGSRTRLPSRVNRARRNIQDGRPCVCVWTLTRGPKLPSKSGSCEPPGTAVSPQDPLSLRPLGCCPLPAEGGRSPAPEWHPKTCPPFLKISGVVMEGYLATAAAFRDPSGGRHKSCHSHSERRGPRGPGGRGRRGRWYHSLVRPRGPS